MTAFAETGLPGWVVRRPPPRPWTFTVSASEPSAAFALTNSWAIGAVLMIGVAVAFTAVAIRQVARLSHMQADFVTNVSHQLKTPITILSGVTETLCHGRVTSPEKVTEYAEVAHLQTKRLASLVDRIVIFSKAHDGGRAHFELIDFSRLVSVAVATFRQRPGPAAHITEQIDSRPMFVHGDVDALEHVVINLLENAVKYGGGPESEVIVRVSPAGSEVTLSIEDRGAGIDPSELGRVFEKFYRGKTDRHKAGGFGLGLAIVRQAVTAHGGRVAAASQPGKGSVFTVSLPAVREESAHALARADR
jgi:two-component system phosphate regulon sensor histidine kinase PhoR